MLATSTSEALLGGVGVASGLGRLARAASSGASETGLLRHLCAIASITLPVDGVGVMRVGQSRLRFVDAGSAPVAAIEQLQEELQDGPCHQSAQTREPVVVPDIARARQWSAFVAGSRRAGLGTMVAVPLVARGRSWGVLDLYRARGAWSDEDLALFSAVADVTAAYVVMSLDHQLALRRGRELSHAATHDELTGLPHRALLLDRITQAVETSAREGTATAVLVADLDRFKSVNDTHGHAAGDTVLTETALRLCRAVGADDTVARLSGDEFVVVRPRLTGSQREVQEEIDRLRRRLRRAVGRPVPLEDRRGGEAAVTVTASIGAVLTTTPCQAETLLDDADRAMYRAKRRAARRSRDRRAPTSVK